MALFRKQEDQDSDHIERIRNVDGVNIIHIRGDFDINSTPNMCKAIEQQSLDQNPKAVLLDFSEVQRIDSTAFACLISLIKNRIGDSRKIAVFNLNASQQSLVDILHVHDIIHIFATEKEALDFFS